MRVLGKLKNKKVLVFYLVGVLLLSFGVSFAYFVATSSVTGDGITATVETAKVQSDGIVADGNIDLNNIDMYPGHKGIASIKVTGTGDHEPLMFDVIFQGNNTFNTSINYTIYQSNSNIDASYTCEVKNDIVNNGKTYYEECTGNHIDELGTSIGSGTISKGEGVSELLNDEIILTTEEGTITYYYVVIEFPNLDQSQNDDMGASISGNITIQEGSKYQAPDLLITANATSGSNGWYKDVLLTTSITTQTGNYDVKYCVTSEDSCTPTEVASITNNSFDVTLDSNANNQKLCIRVEDEYNQIKEGCSNTYKVDKVIPTSNITVASSTAGSNGWYRSVTLKASGSDSDSGVAGIEYCTTTSSSCTPSTRVDGSSANISLSAGTGVKACARAIDQAGNTGSTTCSSAYNIDGTNPTVSITSISATNNSISVTVNGSDSHSGIYQYRFSNNGGSSYTTITSSNSSYTYTFTGLTAGTTYNIAVQAVDTSGRVSSIATRSIATSRPANETILANYPTRLTRTNFNTTVTNTTTGTIYYADTSKGRTYYFAGNPTDNWVKFGGFYWRIIRINEDGSIRMIYHGSSPSKYGYHIGNSAFNNLYDNNMYVGYMYSSGQVHGLTTHSTVKGVLDQWYQNNLISVADKIDGDAGFCGDRTPYNGDGKGTRQTYYGAYNRIHNSNVPTFECTNSSDLYTTSGSSVGNGALTYPIGLISMDEVWFAGSILSDAAYINTSFYLYMPYTSWTMTPSYYVDDVWGARVFQLFFSALNDTNTRVSSDAGIRPVINLKSTVTISGGTGTSSNPYVIS